MSPSSASILARLKNRAKKEQIAFQQLLNLLFQETFIRRLSQSAYKDLLILKGGYLLYSVSGFTTRPTVDSDYLLKDFPSDVKSVEKMVVEIINQKSSNPELKMTIKSIEIIGETKDYHGYRVNLLGSLGKTKTPFSIDIGVGDSVVPAPIKRMLPVLLDDFQKPTISTYTLESVISEKFDAIIRFMDFTGRMKDLYDIYYLATSFTFEGKNLQMAIEETFKKRKTPYEKDSVQVLERLVINKDIRNRWQNFCKKVLHYDLELNRVIHTIMVLLKEPFEAMVEKKEMNKLWSPEHGCYE